MIKNDFSLHFGKRRGGNHRTYLGDGVIWAGTRQTLANMGFSEIVYPWNLVVGLEISIG